jgi:DNA polymerase-1
MTSLLLVNTSNIYMRNRFKLGDRMSRSDGVPSGALYGTFRTIMAAQRRFDADEVVLCFEHGGKKTRQQLDPSYKADRTYKESTPEYAQHMQALTAWAIAMSYRLASAHGTEADDVIAALAASHPVGEDVFIMSSDHDFKKLLREDVHLVRDPKSETYEVQDLQTELNNSDPNDYLKIQVLTGDSSDNVKGVPGIGPVKAHKLLVKHGWDLGAVMEDPKVKPYAAAIARNLVVLGWLPLGVADIDVSPVMPRDLLTEDMIYESWEFESLRTVNDSQALA